MFDSGPCQTRQKNPQLSPLISRCERSRTPFSHRANPHLVPIEIFPWRFSLTPCFSGMLCDCAVTVNRFNRFPQTRGRPRTTSDAHAYPPSVICPLPSAIAAIHSLVPALYYLVPLTALHDFATDDSARHPYPISGDRPN